MKLLKRIFVFGCVALVILVVLGITFTVGWRPFIGPRIRPLSDKKFESTPARLERGQYLVKGVVGCIDCHSEHLHLKHTGTIFGSRADDS